MSKKVNQFIDNEALESGSVVEPTSDEESDSEILVAEPPKSKANKRSKAKPETKALKKKKVGGVTYDILKDPPKAGPSKEPLDNFCKMGRLFFNHILNEF